MFLIYINDLSDNLEWNPKLFADDTSLFSVVKNFDASNIDLNNDFNADPAKQAQELIFCDKVQTTNHRPLFFSENVVLKTTLQKHLGMFQDSKWNFSEPLKTIFIKLIKP